MSIQVELSELAAALRVYRFAYLVTITDQGRAHLVAVRPEISGAELVIGDVGRRTLANARERPDVTLVWPPMEPGGYSLILDGSVLDGSVSDHDGRLRVVPSRAVLHRSAPGEAAAPSQPAAAGCQSDCVEVPLVEALQPPAAERAPRH